MDVAKVETFKNFTILNTVELFLIQYFKEVYSKINYPEITLILASFTHVDRISFIFAAVYMVCRKPGQELDEV